MRLFRIAVPASDIDRSRAFYEQVLAMPADDTVPSRLYFHCDGVILVVVDWATERDGALHPIPDDLYVATGDLDDTYRRAVAAGAEMRAEIAEQPWGERSFYCSDPDGNRLCFVDESTLFLGRGADWS